MSLYQSLQTTKEGQKMLTGIVSTAAAITTVNSGMRNVDVVQLSFVGAPTVAHNLMDYTVSASKVMIQAKVMKVAGSAITVSAAASSFSNVSYIIIGDEQPPAAT